jgi:TonB family protein
MQIARRTLTAVLFAALSTAAPASAEPTLTPPAVETYVDADYPADGEGRAAEVELELVVGVDGVVTDAHVVTPAGNGFDEAALAAVQQVIFTPASKDGVAVAARIRYRYVFAAPAPVPVAIAFGRLDGRVLSRTTGQPLVGVDVTIRTGETSHTVVTDETGTFSAGDLAPGTYHVTIAALDYATLAEDETIASSEVATVTYRLAPVAAPAAGSYGAVATIEAPSREITRRTVEASELTKIAGTRGDALRAIEVLPGVGRPPSLSGMLILRGSGHGDSQVFLDGAPVDQLYHFGGLTSFVNGSLLRRVELYPGNFSARYGRKLGGIVEAELRDPKTDRVHAGLEINMIDASGLVEGPLTEKLSFATAARRSWVDTWLGPVLESTGSDVTAAPVYLDWQAILSYRQSANDRLRVVAYGSSDELSLIAGRPGGEMSTKRDRFGQANSMQRIGVDWRHRNTAIDQDVSATIGWRSNRLEAGVDLTTDIHGIEVSGRGDWRANLARRVSVGWGLDIQYTRADIAYFGPKIELTEGNPRDMNGPRMDSTTLDATSAWFRPGAYAETTVTPLAALSLTAGLRADYFGEIEAYAIDPRLTGRYRLGATTLKAGVGQFSQPPEMGQALPKLGNPDLVAAHAMHYSAGVEQQLTDRISLGVEGYYKQLDSLVVNGPEGLANTGVGRIYGAELAGRWMPGGRVSGFLSYSLSRSERNDDGSKWRLFDYDQTHILTAAASVDLGNHWEAGGTFRIVSGNPETPVVASLFDANAGTYQPIYGETNSARSPIFHRLDLRIEKHFTLGGHPMSGYLDLQNAYNQRNSEGTSYSYDYSQRHDTPGLPVIPSFGIKGEL